MKKFVTRAIIIALIGSTGILSGCYGPFRLTTKLHQWNGNVSNIGILGIMYLTCL